MKRFVFLTVWLVSTVAACDDEGGQNAGRDADAGGRDGPMIDGGTDTSVDVRDTGSSDATFSEVADASPDASSTVDAGGGGPESCDAEPMDLPPAGIDSPPREWMLMNDFDGNADLPSFWALFVAGRMTGDSGDPPTATISPPRAASRNAMRLMGPAVADGAIINVHHLFDWTQLFTGVRFWARATGGDQPTEILVALTDLRSNTELYYAGLRAQRPWRVKRLQLTGEWQQFSVRFDDLAPEGTGTAVPLHGTGTNGGGELHFIVPENRAYDVWIDDVELGCKTGRCGPGFI